MHERIYHNVLDVKFEKVVDQQSINVDWLRDNPDDFPGDMELCEKHDHVKLMTLEKPYSVDLVMEFFAAVFFRDDKAKTMTWMSAGHRCEKNLAQFAALLGYEVKAKGDPAYRRIHAKAIMPGSSSPTHCYSRDNVDLAPLVVHLNARYHTMEKVVKKIKSDDERQKAKKDTKEGSGEETLLGEYI
jgi:hypothetical protein